jgi:hypothetical protein
VCFDADQDYGVRPGTFTGGKSPKAWLLEEL